MSRLYISAFLLFALVVSAHSAPRGHYKKKKVEKKVEVSAPSVNQKVAETAATNRRLKEVEFLRDLIDFMVKGTEFPLSISHLRPDIPNSYISQSRCFPAPDMLFATMLLGIGPTRLSQLVPSCTPGLEEGLRPKLYTPMGGWVGSFNELLGPLSSAVSMIPTPYPVPTCQNAICCYQQGLFCTDTVFIRGFRF